MEEFKANEIAYYRKEGKLRATKIAKIIMKDNILQAYFTTGCYCSSYYIPVSKLYHSFEEVIESEKK